MFYDVIQALPDTFQNVSPMNKTFQLYVQTTLSLVEDKYKDKCLYLTLNILRHKLQ